MPNKVDITKLLQGLSQYGEAVQVRLHAAVNEFAEATLADSQEIVPVDTTLLQKSAHVQTVQEGSKVKSTLSYNTAYAAIVHERLDVNHKAPTRAKYLEIPMKENAPKFLPYVAQRLQQLRGGNA